MEREIKQKILNNINLGQGQLGEELVKILTKSINEKSSVESIIIEEAIRKNPENHSDLFGISF